VGILAFDFLEHFAHDCIEEEFDAVRGPFQFILESSKIGGKEVEFCIKGEESCQNSIF